MLSEGIGSSAARVFETSIFILIFTGVGIGVLQTVNGHENDLNEIETFTVVMFTLEYLVRFIGAGANPEFAAGGGGPIRSRIRYIFSFYSIIDLLSFVPFYLSLAVGQVYPQHYVNRRRDTTQIQRTSDCSICLLVSLDSFCSSLICF
jgi:hypothetical protein